MSSENNRIDETEADQLVRGNFDLIKATLLRIVSEDGTKQAFTQSDIKQLVNVGFDLLLPITMDAALGGDDTRRIDLLLEQLSNPSFYYFLGDKLRENARGEYRRKLREIIIRSGQAVVLTGPSGVGKGEVMKFLTATYGFHETPFITTRELRPGEAESGSRSVTAEEFLALKASGELVLDVAAYGNLYGYPIDDILTFLYKGKYIMLEAPPSRIRTDVDTVLPKATKIAFIPTESQRFIQANLKKRGTESKEQQTLRRAEALADLRHLEQLCGQSDIYPIIPTQGNIRSTIVQVQRIFERNVTGHSLIEHMRILSHPEIELPVHPQTTTQLINRELKRALTSA